MDGFFVAKLKKFANGEKKVEGVSDKSEEQEFANKETDKKKKLNLKKKQQKKNSKKAK